MQTWLKQNPIALIGIGILVIGFVPKLVSGEFQRDATVSQQLTEQRKADEMNAQRLAIAQESRKDLQKIANERYSGCTLVVRADNHTKATGLTIGKPVLDGSRPGVHLADGITVCDQNGMTAIITDGVAAEPAVTTDRAVVESALRRFGYDGTLAGKLHYSAPQQ
ncbi:hypothetical protein H6F76_03020 [Leptolyngbya sp. FACHB-321]|uniref:hypothetical protein n=1 Tax=Leptolyngbya sp. FACHB-321 TaxID=2692807 RepID=UPI001685FBDA|nr:hypothetical protein [Leptolyngbya sp. FACHB-321]MBD2034022.1 hypothetical protein [Leptolyngbya sp. FACHB-321]